MTPTIDQLKSAGYTIETDPDCYPNGLILRSPDGSVAFGASADVLWAVARHHWRWGLIGAPNA